MITLMRLLCGIFVLVFFFVEKHKSAPIYPRSTAYPSSWSLSAMNFMKRYGYLEKGTMDSEALYKESAIKEAIKNVQRFGDLPITGKLDNATIKLMASPRCGVPDIVRKGSTRQKRYIIGSEGWRKREITYFIANWSPKLGEEPVMDEIERAFDTWSGYSRLNFRPINTPNADIIIAFGQGAHGDEYPFDGPGNILAHAFFPYEMAGYGGDIHFDDDEKWMIRPTDPYEGTDFFTVAVHELGHSLGLSHSTVPSSIMFPYYKGYSPGFQLDYDDILAVYHLYISQPPLEESTSEKDLYETTEPGTISSTSTDNSNDLDDLERSTNEETVVSNSSTSTTEKAGSVTFVGDYETVEEHRGHERKNGTNGAINQNVIPDPCEGNYDSIFVLRNELFVFKQQFLWRFVIRGNVENGYPMNFHQFFHGMPENITRIDASYERQTDGSVVLFTGNIFWVYDGKKFIENSPRFLTDYGISDEVKTIDAAQVWAKNGKTYIYSGDQFWRYDERTRTLDPGYPQHIQRWRGIPPNIDAAMTWTDGNTYFFKDTLFWRFDNTLIKTDDRYPLVASEFWFGCQ